MRIYLFLLIMALLVLGCTGNPPASTASASPTTQLESTLPPISTITTNSGNGGNMAAVANGDKVGVWYLGTLDDGTVFDTNIVEEAKKAGSYQASRPYTPLEFTVGAGEMIKGFDAGVVGMKQGETKTIKIPPKEAYGELRADLITKIPIIDLKASGIDPKPGTIVSTGTGARGVIRSVDSQNATIDFNHFLAGQTLTFKITVEKVTK
ncbi:MAG TPA: peptidylprolyl isomerase [Candidatus Norongarragalinales archaeon]|nr:peptidylprolyl isomerase [Candidatus Norongarragalinales archaeon]